MGVKIYWISKYHSPLKFDLSLSYWV